MLHCDACAGGWRIQEIRSSPKDCSFVPKHSIIDHSLYARLGATTTDGDGFGIGWYSEDPQPGVFQNIDPAWNDPNPLREVACRIQTPPLFAHIRAFTGTPMQRSNCHPFHPGADEIRTFEPIAP